MAFLEILIIINVEVLLKMEKQLFSDMNHQINKFDQGKVRLIWNIIE